MYVEMYDISMEVRRMFNLAEVQTIDQTTKGDIALTLRTGTIRYVRGNYDMLREMLLKKGDLFVMSAPEDNAAD